MASVPTPGGASVGATPVLPGTTNWVPGNARADRVDTERLREVEVAKACQDRDVVVDPMADVFDHRRLGSVQPTGLLDADGPDGDSRADDKGRRSAADRVDERPGQDRRAGGVGVGSERNVLLAQAEEASFDAEGVAGVEPGAEGESAAGCGAELEGGRPIAGVVKAASAGPVVTTGKGRWASLVHQTRYSAEAQAR